MKNHSWKNTTPATKYYSGRQTKAVEQNIKTLHFINALFHLNRNPKEIDSFFLFEMENE